MTTDLTKFGGKRIQNRAFNTVPGGNFEVWDFGYVGPGDRTDKQEQAVQAVNATLWTGDVAADAADDGRLVASWEAIKAVNNDSHFYSLWQQTGSCVPHGGGQVMIAMGAEEALAGEESEEFVMPFFLFNYGPSRQRGGLGSRQGEGSMGSSLAASYHEDGFLRSDAPGVPKYKLDGRNLTYGSAIEMQWSAGYSQVTPLLPESKQHLVREITQVKTGEDGWALLRNRNWQTCASSWGGLMQCPVQGTPGVRLSRHATTWNHQMSAHASWVHPTLGRIVYLMNNWRDDAHGPPAYGEWPGGFWILFKDYDWICQTGEVIAYSRLQGFALQQIDWKSAV